ncbi:MAG: sulfatase-like hydrolase/transferase, partial [Mariprofundaceae bacterium]|nr:sulfatase-like hydrolase/transferase [Mariprofundaceae bacterium]
MERYLRTGVPDPVIGDWASPPEFGSQGDLIAPSHIDLKGEALLSARAAYYGAINHVDDQMRRLLNGITLGGLGLNDNTIVVFTSDHGEMLGDHYRWRKSVPYEASARVPFMIRAPKEFGIESTSTVNAIATHTDIMPTLLDLAGIAIPDHLDGKSLMPLIRGEKTQCREYLHIEHAPEHQTLTDGIEKYIWLPACGSEQFFDLTTDPNECHNLASDPQHADRVTFWRERMIKELANRPEGFSDGRSLIAGRPYGAVILGRS